MFGLVPAVAVLYISKEIAGLATVVTSVIDVKDTFGISSPFPFGLVNVFPVFKSNIVEAAGEAPVLFIPTFCPVIILHKIIKVMIPYLRVILVILKLVNLILSY